MEHTGFPSDETLASFLDGKLDPETRRRVIEHMTTCDECYATVTGGGGVLESRKNAEPVGPSRKNLFRWSSLAAGLVVLAASGLLFLTHHDTNKTAVERLAGIAPPTRRIEGRLTAFAYAPWESPKRGGGEAGDRTTEAATELAYERLQAEAQSLAAKATLTPTTDNRHAFGMSLLLLGKTNDAVLVFEETLCSETHESTVPAAIVKSTDASLLSDLSAAYSARATMDGKHALDVPKAVEAVERAHHLRPKSPIVLWNRAVAIEKLQVSEQTAAAWRDYLAVDGDSQWAAEARIHLENATKTSEATTWLNVLPSLRAAILRGDDGSAVRQVASHVEAGRSTILQTVGEWASAYIGGDTQRASELLQLAKGLTNALAATSSDRFAADLVNAVRPNTAEALASLHSQYGEASAEMGNGDYRGAARTLESLWPQIERLTPALASLARYDLATCYFSAERYKEALARTQDLGAVATARHYLSLAGRSASLQGLICGRIGRHYEAITAFRYAIDSYEQASEFANAATARAFLSEREQALGRHEEAWSDRFAALTQLDRVIKHDWRENMMVNTALAAKTDHYPTTAYHFITAAIDTARRRGDIIAQHDGLIFRSELRLDLDDADGALTDINIASALRKRMTPEICARAEVLASAGEALVVAQQSADRALQIINAALVHCQSLGSRYEIPELSYTKATILIGRAAPTDEILTAVSTGIKEVEEQARGAKLIDQTDPVAEQLYRLAVALCLRDADASTALEYADRYRRYALHAQLAPVSAADTDSQESSLSYFFTPDGLFAFVRRGSTTRSFRIEMDEQEIAASVERFWSPTASSLARAAALSQLAHLLTQPLVSALFPCQLITIVPDRVLFRVPFAALATKDRTCLITSVPVVRASLARGHSVDQEMAVANKSILIIGNPAFSVREFAGLPNLADAEMEAEAIASMYSHAIRLERREATRERFLALAPRFAVITIATHALSGGDSPLDVALVLAPDPNERDNGALYARDILRLDLSGVDLVLLSGCHTGAPGSTFPGGSVADAFVAAGAKSTLATLATVSDEYAKHFVTALHHRLVRGEPIVQAFAETQRAFARVSKVSDASAYAWASFELTVNRI